MIESNPFWTWKGQNSFWVIPSSKNVLQISPSPGRTSPAFKIQTFGAFATCSLGVSHYLKEKWSINSIHPRKLLVLSYLKFFSETLTSKPPLHLLSAASTAGQGEAFWAEKMEETGSNPVSDQESVGGKEQFQNDNINNGLLFFFQLQLGTENNWRV